MRGPACAARAPARPRAASRGRPLAHKMAAPAYPAWVGRWVTGQWRQKKRPPLVRPTRPLVLADKVANRRETAGGEFPAAGPVNAASPSLVLGSWPRCLSPGRVVWCQGVLRSLLGSALCSEGRFCKVSKCCSGKAVV